MDWPTLIVDERSSRRDAPTLSANTSGHATFDAELPVPYFFLEQSGQVPE